MRHRRMPGTFKDPVQEVKRDLSQEGAFAERLLRNAGAIHAERWTLGACTIMVARERLRGHWRWHLSIAHPGRYPTWDEMKTALLSIEAVKGVTLAQVITPGDDTPWVNAHDNCFHWFEIHDDVVRMGQVDE